MEQTRGQEVVQREEDAHQGLHPRQRDCGQRERHSPGNKLTGELGIRDNHCVIASMGQGFNDKFSLPQAISPRRRGAAGIRGLGAPGTAPSKQLVQQFCSLGGFGGNGFVGGFVSPLSLSPASGGSCSSSASSGGISNHKTALPPAGAVALFR